MTFQYIWADNSVKLKFISKQFGNKKNTPENKQTSTQTNIKTQLLPVEKTKSYFVMLIKNDKNAGNCTSEIKAYNQTVSKLKSKPMIQ